MTGQYSVWEYPLRSISLTLLWPLRGLLWEAEASAVATNAHFALAPLKRDCALWIDWARERTNYIACPYIEFT